eukprot:m.100305 g.100305  ORF g.100305 m.100305 type:complete len:677 (+) comp9044_c0_seq2:280-2310(+)
MSLVILKEFVDQLPNNGWFEASDYVWKHHDKLSPEDVIASGFIEIAMDCFQKNENMIGCTRALWYLMRHSNVVVDHILKMRYIDLLMDVERIFEFEPRTILSILYSLQDLSFYFPTECFKALPIIKHALLQNLGEAHTITCHASLMNMALHEGLQKPFMDDKELMTMVEETVYDPQSAIKPRKHACGFVTNLYFGNGLSQKEKGQLDELYAFILGFLRGDDLELKLAVLKSCNTYKLEEMGVRKVLNKNNVPLIMIEILQDKKASIEFRAVASGGLWNFSGCDYGAKALFDLGKVPDIVDIFNTASWKELDDNDESPKYKLVGVLCNLCLYLPQEHLNELRELGLHDILHELMQSKDPSKQPVNAAIGLSCLVGHVENNPMLLADSTIFEMMCECLEKTREGTGFHGCSFEQWEPIGGLSHLSVSDSNKALLHDTKCVECVCKGFKLGADERSDECVAKLISNMSFKYDLEKDFDASVNVLAVINTIKEKSKSLEARRLANIALFQQQMKQRSPQPLKAIATIISTSSSSAPMLTTTASATTKVPKCVEQVMLSGPHGRIDNVKSLRSFLEDEGVNVWMNETIGMTLDDMACVVESSHVVVMCLCDAYKNSHICRAECEYALQTQKPIVLFSLEEGYEPDGWLHRLADGRKIETTRDGLVKEIWNHATKPASKIEK